MISVLEGAIAIAIGAGLTAGFVIAGRGAIEGKEAWEGRTDLRDNHH